MGFVSIATLLFVGKIVGSVTAIVGFIAGVQRVITWIKNKLSNIDNNVIELKKSMDTHITGLREDIKIQTTTLATALSEQRQDFRTFYAPTMMLQQMQQMQQPLPVPVRAKRKRAVKKK